MHRPLIPALVTLTAAFAAALALWPADAPAQDPPVEKSPYVADCKGLESTLAMAQRATRAITLDLTPCADLTGDDRSRCRKSIQDGYDTALESARNAEKAAKKLLACCQKPGSKDCKRTPAKKR